MFVIHSPLVNACNDCCSKSEVLIIRDRDRKRLVGAQSFYFYLELFSAKSSKQVVEGERPVLARRPPTDDVSAHACSAYRDWSIRNRRIRISKSTVACSIAVIQCLCCCFVLRTSV